MRERKSMWQQGTQELTEARIVKPEKTELRKGNEKKRKRLRIEILNGKATRIKPMCPC
jgi:hypothetical protein